MSKLIKRKKRARSSSTKSEIRGIQYVLPIGNGWVIKGSKHKKFTLLTMSKREAVFYARSIAKRNGDILEVHERGGKISERKKYRKTAPKL